jgi:hypothetical protein
MKTTIKVFIWMGMLFFGFLVYPVIVGIKAYRALDKKGISVNEIYKWAALTLFFVSPIAGILMFTLDEKDLRNDDLSNNELNTFISSAEKIIKLKELLDKGIISQEVFDEKSKKYIEEL